MANIRCYFGIENINLTNPQRLTLITGLQALGDNTSANPCNRNHWRIRTDNNAVIFEALFDEDNLTIDAIKQRLATIFGVAVGTISHSTSQNATYGLIVTFTHSAQAKIRMVAFGYNGSWRTWAESNAAARAYLAANAAAWGDV
jgi:hypothetical protein